MVNASAGNQRAAPFGPARRWVALAAVAAGALALVLLPVASRPGPAIPGIVPLFAAGLLITELSTSYLLLVRFRAVPTWSILLLGCAYFYSGLMPIPHLLTFPGAVLADRPLVGTSSQSTSWLYVSWINGFALLSLIAVSLQVRFSEHRIASKNLGRAVAAGVCLTAAAALTVVVLAVAAPSRLPSMVSGQRFTDLSLLASYLSVVFLAASIATGLLGIGEQNRLFLWLTLALTGMAFANVVSTVGGGRFTVGWTIGRLSWLASAGVLFVYLMVLHARDQQLWSHARQLLSGGAEGEGVIIREAIPAALETFVARENVMRYRRMLEEPSDEAHRQVLLRMVEEEETRLKRLDLSRTERPPKQPSEK